jgi:NhaA family Na+:H+ antiporter
VARSLQTPAAKRPIERLLSPVYAFLRIEAAGGILLLACTVAALGWANSPWRGLYQDLWHAPLSIELGALHLSESLAHWVNDGLMAVFFFVVGLEIKRELLAGELCSPRQAAVPIAAAAGGMAVPAVVYLLVNAGDGAALRGWAVPCATDIAFALGVMALLGKRVPVALKVFLTALAIVDDIGAVIIIALFYTADLSPAALGAAAAILAAMIGANRLHVRQPVAYAILGALLWAAMLRSGVHATIAGVLAAFTIPARVRIRGADFVAFSRQALDGIVAAGGDANEVVASRSRQDWIDALERACEGVQPPTLRLERMLHPWSSFLIMPIFALANAGLELDGQLLEALSDRVTLGAVAGLVAGKQTGVMLATWLVVRSGLGALPAGAGWRHVYAASWLAGIGFTMSLFIAGLSFGESEALDHSRLGILLGSLVCGCAGWALLRAATGRVRNAQ